MGPRLCPDCREANSDRARYCQYCGAGLQGATEPSAESRKTVSIVFSDIVGSTSLAESMDAEVWGELMVRYFARMREILDRHGGRIEKFIGDAVMTVFGVPIAREDDALRAVRAADEMRSALAELNETLMNDYGVELVTRTGVNTGEVVTADPSAEQTLPLGDAANVAARLEQAAGPGEILIGERTYRLIRDFATVEPAGAIKLKGKSGEVLAFRLLNAAMPVRRPRAPLVGREQELEVLERALDASIATGNGRSVLIVGDAGIGKSRLIEEFEQRSSTRARALLGRCPSFGEGVTYRPLADVVGAAAQIHVSDPRDVARSKVATLVVDDVDGPAIAGALSQAMGLSEGGYGTDEIAWAFRKLCEHLSRSGPVILIFEDLHWAEPAFVELVEDTGERSAGPILVLATVRPGSDVAAAEGPAAADGSIVELQPLSGELTDGLVRGLLGTAAPPGEVIERIRAITEGNPFFVEELVTMLIDDGLLHRTETGWDVVRELSSASIPPTIDALLTARIDRLQTRERGVLQSAAVIGKVFYPQAVGRLLEESGDGVQASLARLVAGGFVVEDQTEFLGEKAMRFRHALIQEASYASTPKRSRASLHEAFGSWLEEVLGDRIGEFDEIVGYHLEHAYRYRVELRTATPDASALATRAATYFESAGRRSHARGDVRAAVGLLSRAVDLAAQTGAPPSPLLSRLAMVLAEAGRLDEGADAALESARRAVEVGDDVAAAFARIVLGRIDLSRGAKKDDEVHGELVEAIEVLERGQAHAELAQAHVLLYLLLLSQCRMADAEAALQRAAAEAKQGGDGQAGSLALAYLAGSSAYGPKPTPSCIRLCEEILLEAGDNLVVSAGALAGLARLYAMVGRLADARRSAADAFRIVDDLGWHQIRSGLEIELALWVRIPDGDHAGAEADLRRALATLRERGEEAEVPDAYALLARCAYIGGRYPEAEELARQAVELADPADVISTTLALGVHAMALARCGELERAERLARGAVQGIASTDALPFRAQALSDLGEVLEVGGKFDEAIPVFQETLALHERKGNLVGAATARDRLSILTGRR